ncbi:MAG: hypothetical protein LCI03_11600 [Actinobacteria bacterium]|jgi:hypothetical protein|nr:hypothetical protein [Actinomycetota bacterium]
MAVTGDRTQRGGWLKPVAWLLGVVYLLCVLAALASAFVLVNAAEDTCSFEDEGWARWGTPSWSWLPVGQTCEYSLNLHVASGQGVPVVHRDAPSPFVTVGLALLVVAPAGAYVAYRLGARSRDAV